MKISKTFGLIGGGAAALALSAGIILVAFPRGAGAAPVDLREDGQPVARVSAEDAIDAASERVGFDVRPLGNLPPGVRLELVDSTRGPEDPARAVPMAFLTYARAVPESASADTYDLKIRVEQTGFRFGAPTGRGQNAEQLTTDFPNTDVYVEETDRVLAITLLTPDRGFLVLISGSARLSLDEALPVVRTLLP